MSSPQPGQPQRRGREQQEDERALPWFVPLMLVAPLAVVIAVVIVVAMIVGAAALFTLGSDVPLTISSLASKGQVWRRGFMEDEVYELLMGVQSIFEDKWLQPEPTETVH